MNALHRDATPEEKLQHIADRVLDQEAMRKVMQQAVADGIKAVVSDPAFWAAAGAAMQQRAQSTAGGWLFAGLRAAFSKVGLILIVLIGVGMVGGWPAFFATLKSILGGHTP